MSAYPKILVAIAGPEEEHTHVYYTDRKGLSTSSIDKSMNCQESFI
jgi:hypothetical protein